MGVPASQARASSIQAAAGLLVPLRWAGGTPALVHTVVHLVLSAHGAHLRQALGLGELAEHLPHCRLCIGLSVHSACQLSQEA